MAKKKSCSFGFIHKVIVGVTLWVCSGNYTCGLVVDNICKIQPFFLFRDQNDRSALHLAALKGSARCCEAILQKFDDCVNWTDKNKAIFFELYLKVVINHWLTLFYAKGMLEKDSTEGNCHTHVDDIVWHVFRRITYSKNSFKPERLCLLANSGNSFLALLLKCRRVTSLPFFRSTFSVSYPF